MQKLKLKTAELKLKTPKKYLDVFTGVFQLLFQVINFKL